MNYKTCALLLACGIDPSKSIIFAQSSVNYHLELYWLLACATPLHWINRMTQYKQKQDEGMFASIGLYSYPVLMASDIMLYNANVVPVGEDQTLHMQLTRQLVDRMNLLIGRNARFNRPEIYKAPYSTEYRVMDLQDGTKKMSKSARSLKGTLFLDDSDEEIYHKIMGSKVDKISKLYEDPGKRPEITNLIKIYQAISTDNIDADKIENMEILEFKESLAKKLINLYIFIFRCIKKNWTYTKKIHRINKIRKWYIANTKNIK